MDIYLYVHLHEKYIHYHLIYTVSFIYGWKLYILAVKIYFFGWLADWLIVEITDIKCGFLSKHLFQRTQQHGSCKKPLGGIDNLYKKQCLPAIT